MKPGIEGREKRRCERRQMVETHDERRRARCGADDER